MLKSLLSVLLILLACPVLVARAAEHETLKLVVPRGDAQAGREAFVALSCTSCHAVQGDTELAKPVAVMSVPVLGKALAKRSPSKLSSSIVSPSHLVSKEVRSKAEGDLSPMGDLTASMTVRQLIDLVAYLRSLDG